MFLAACEAGSSTGSREVVRPDGFTATESTEQTIRGEDPTDPKDTPTVLRFWAPECPTCRAQAREVISLAHQYRGSIHFVGVGGLAPVAEVRDYAKQLTTLSVMVDEDGSMGSHFRITAQSTYVLIDKYGKTVFTGYLDNADLADKVAALWQLSHLGP